MKSEEYWIKIREVAPDALVIFTSDHGDMLGAHRLFSKNAAAYKEVANIPLIIKGGAKGYVEEAMASHIDIAPTILDYFDIHYYDLWKERVCFHRLRIQKKKLTM